MNTNNIIQENKHLWDLCHSYQRKISKMESTLETIKDCITTISTVKDSAVRLIDRALEQNND